MPFLIFSDIFLVFSTCRREFTICLQHQRRLLSFLRSFSQAQSSSGCIFTRTASSPMHSILSHGMIKHSSPPNPIKPVSRQTMSAHILPSQVSNSKAQACPRRAPSHRFITSFSLSSQVVDLFGISCTAFRYVPLLLRFYFIRQNGNTERTRHRSRYRDIIFPGGDIRFSRFCRLSHAPRYTAEISREPR